MGAAIFSRKPNFLLLLVVKGLKGLRRWVLHVLPEFRQGIVLCLNHEDEKENDNQHDFQETERSVGPRLH